MTHADLEASYERTITSPIPLDPIIAKQRLTEVKQIFDNLGVTFWLGSGTCLGCVRENRFIPWDDEMDTASVIGMHGLTEDRVTEVAQCFDENGFYARLRPNPRWISIALVKDGIRTDWTCHRIVEGYAIEFPGIKLPLSLFERLTEVNFVGAQFLLPTPPEHYLELKYGPEWRTPKGPGFERDVIDQIPRNSNLTPWYKMMTLCTFGQIPRRNIQVTVLDRKGQIVKNASVMVAGFDHVETNIKGIARFYVPSGGYYALRISYPGHEEVLYEEQLKPGMQLIYRPGPVVSPEQHYKAGVRAMALTEE